VTRITAFRLFAGVLVGAAVLVGASAGAQSLFSPMGCDGGPDGAFNRQRDNFPSTDVPEDCRRLCQKWRSRCTRAVAASMHCEITQINGNYGIERILCGSDKDCRKQLAEARKQGKQELKEDRAEALDKCNRTSFQEICLQECTGIQ
jgi:hypothetical protein